MKIVKILLPVIAFLLFSYQLFLFFWFDEIALKKIVSGGVPARFIQADEETIKRLEGSLKALTPVPKEVFLLPKKEELGRIILFTP